jgi:hypothetical protein
MTREVESPIRPRPTLASEHLLPLAERPSASPSILEKT